MKDRFTGARGPAISSSILYDCARVVVSWGVIQSAVEYAMWFDAGPSIERSRFLSRERADTATWLQIIDEYPRCRRAVSRNSTISLEVLERLRVARDYGVQFRVRSLDLWREAHPEDVSPFDFDPSELVEYDLTTLERDVLRQGLLQWGGPAYCTEELAVAMGFTSISNLITEGDRIAAALEDYHPMKHIDWGRALLATEIVFMSDAVGAGLDWEIVTGISDSETLETIRELQRHFASPVIGRAFGTP